MPSSEPRRPLLVLGLFFLSGAAGLGYEIAWSRQLTLHLGGLVPALTVLLAAQMGGMALGSWIGGRWCRHPGHPLRRFAVLEFLTAAAALSVGVGLDVLDPVFGHLYQISIMGGGNFASSAGVVSALLVVPAAMAMGATLPVLAQLATVGPRSAARLSGSLYAVNTLGAVAGCLLAGMWALPALGITGTVIVAAITNVSVGLVALVMSGGTRAALKGSEHPAAASPRSGLVLLSILLAGIGSMVSQIGWTRALTLSLGSSTYAFTVTLAAFLTGLGLGGAVGTRWATTSARPTRTLVLLQSSAALLALFSIHVLGRLPVWLVPPLAEAGGRFRLVWGIQAVAASTVVLGPTLLLGATFPIAVRLRGETGRGPGRAAGEVYAVSSAGLVIGALAAGFWLLPALGLRSALLAAAGLVSLAALPAGFSRRPDEESAPTVAGIGLVTMALLAIALPHWDPAVMTSGPYLYVSIYQAPPGSPELGGAGRLAGAPDTGAPFRERGSVLFYREGAAATVSVRRTPQGILSLQINGKTDASTGGDMVTQLLAGHLPGLLGREAPRSALMIGLASGVSLGALERYPFQEIDCVELLPEVAEAASLFAGANGDALADPRLRLIVGDGRNHLLHGTSRYDVISSQPTNPWVAGTAALYTRETFLAARNRLREGGVMVQWIQGYALLPEDLRSVARTFQGVFPQTFLWEESPGGGDYFLVGYHSADPVRLETTRIAERLRRPAIASDLNRAGIRDLGDLLAHFVMGPEALQQYAQGAAQQRDDRLALEFSAPRALHADTLTDQVRALRRWRESPTAYLAEGDDNRELLASLRRARVQARQEERLILSLPRRLPVQDPDLRIGMELLQAGLPGPAASHLRAAAARHADVGIARALFGAVLMTSGSLPEARSELEAAVQADPADLASVALLARLSLALGDPVEAERRAHQALTLEPRDPDLLNMLGAALLLLDRPLEARQVLERCVLADPELPEAWTNLGVARRRCGELEGATTAYRRAILLDPLAADARFNLAVALHLSGGSGPAESLELLQRLVADDPADLGARLEKARGLRAAGREEEARQDLLELARLAPDSAEAATAVRALTDPDSLQPLPANPDSPAGSPLQP